MTKVGHPVDYISAVLTAVEGESDPRSLVIAFDLLKYLLQAYLTKSNCGSQEVYEGYLEDVFDRVTCYFPINFNPPKDDKFKVTSVELKSKLKECFLSGPADELIASHFVPFLQEKMSSAA
jgi:DNA repair/transcription protein MET18/MMS19